jgi:hypothetical protein
MSNRLDMIKQSPRQASIDDVEWLCEEIERLQNALGNAADMLHKCALECSDCDYGNGATGNGSEGEVCEECAPVCEAEKQARGVL